MVAIIITIFAGCSNDEQYEVRIAELEEEVERVNQKLVEKEDELKQLVTQGDDEILREDGPKLWDDPTIQLWEYVRDFSFAEENGWERGATDWRKWEKTIDSALVSPNESWETPSLLMNAWVEDANFIHLLGTDLWESTLRIHYINEDLAEGYILNYGLKDDSIDGEEIKMIMKRENGYWRIDDVEIRYRCGRSLGEEDCL